MGIMLEKIGGTSVPDLARDSNALCYLWLLISRLIVNALGIWDDIIIKANAEPKIALHQHVSADASPQEALPKFSAMASSK